MSHHRKWTFNNRSSANKHERQSESGDESGDSDKEQNGRQRRVFGAGIKRKRIDFVPARSSGSGGEAGGKDSKMALSERYMAIALGGEFERGNGGGGEEEGTRIKREDEEESAVCDICHAPLRSRSFHGAEADGDDNAISPARDTVPVTKASSDHVFTIAHQACLQHSHPPSHLDRNRHGLKYLSSYGWDPDGRLGLGATGEGIRVPVKGKVKNNTLGLGVRLLGPVDGDGEIRVRREERQKVRPESLNAKGVRKKEADEKRERERLHRMFYMSTDVEKYLGL